jgi:hypothetical protein
MNARASSGLAICRFIERRGILGVERSSQLYAFFLHTLGSRAEGGGRGVEVWVELPRLRCW